MCDQIKMIDPIARKAKFVEKLDDDTLRLTTSIIRTIISPQK